MKNVVPIKNDAQHRQALQRIDELMDAAPGSPEGNELEVLATLVEAYESVRWPVAAPTPIEAIKFRMEQAGLAPKDLVPYIGTRSRVSEVLSGKRPLNLRMARALHRELGIPARALLGGESQLDDEPEELDPGRFPVREMAKRGWFEGFDGTPDQAVKQAEALARRFLAQVQLNKQIIALNRQHVRSGSRMDLYALLAWRVRLLQLAKQQAVTPYNPKVITDQFLRQLVGLSLLDNGPQLAKEFLAKHGIVLVALHHLPGTHLDGAVMMAPWGTPIIGLTLRYDRLDHFWFTLLHEVAHLRLHLKPDELAVFIDDLESEGMDAIEAEADEHARDALIAADEWKRYQVHGNDTFLEAKELAARLRVHPAIVAGRMRWERKNYRMLSSLIGRNRVRSQFANLIGSTRKGVA